MLRIPAWLRAFILMLMVTGVTAPALAACGNDTQPTVQESITPTAYIDPTTGQPCAPWVNNPNEPRVMGMTEPACRLPIPTDQPVREPGMSDADWFLLGGLFGFGMGHHSLYWGPNYYDMAIGPAWDRYPGSYRGYGGRPIVHVDNRTYNTTVINSVNTKYSTQERTAERDPKLSGYKDAKTGKTYTGANVPPKAFASTNAPTKAGGNAGTVNSPNRSNNGSTGKGGYSPPSNSGSSGKGGYSPPSSGRSGGGYSPSPSSGRSGGSTGGGRK
jgi:hypothetical protein